MALVRWCDIYYGKGSTQVYENNPYRGYLSSVQPMAQFGLGNTAAIDSAVVFGLMVLNKPS
jgi:uncharacterized protein YfaQ (DUF2300 family)